ncbi:Pup--protein ligase [Actinomyces sp. HMSC08A01]|nr:Pup--protein ligase [Actinomyces sp. HMSC08A01]
MTRRVIGIETEYGITCASTEGGRPPLDAEHAARELFAPLMEKGRSTNLFLENGGRLYLDVGAHPEYATAECDRLADLVAQDQAGTSMLSDLAAAANKKFASEGIPGRIHLFKNNLDSEGNSCGCHENYMLHRRADFRAMADSLVAFFVTRQILTGAGWVSPEGQYAFSQRSDIMWDAVSSASTRSRPIINTRDEPLADSDLYRRMHVIVGDSNVCQTTTWLKVGMTHLLLNAIDQGVKIDALEISDPMRAIRQINHDLTATEKFEMSTGKAMNALDVQRSFLDYAAAADQSDTPEARDILTLWDKVLTCLAKSDLEPLRTHIDWVAKKALLERASTRHKLPLSSPVIARLDLAYHDITDAGIGQVMVRKGLHSQVVTEEKVQAAKVAPPKTTRACLRGAAIGAAKAMRRDLSADWSHLRLDDGSHGTIGLGDPLKTQDDRVDQLICDIEG